jgi:hypothetical protein
MPNYLKHLSTFILLSISVNMALAIAQDLSILITPAKCYNEKSGTIQVKLSKGASPYIFIVSKDSLHKSEIKRSPLLKEASFSFSGISAGKYYITAICGDGKVYSKAATIDQPPQLMPGKISVESYPRTISARNGVIVANPAGGIPPYIYTWQGNGISGSDSKISGIGTGTFKCSIIDSNKCGPVSATIFLGTKPATKSTGYLHFNRNRNSSAVEKIANQPIS